MSDNDMKTIAAEPAALLRAAAEQVLGKVEWLSATEGECRCPGHGLHTTASSAPGKVFLDGAPTITCFHAHCADKIRAANTVLRRAAHRITGGSRVAPAELRQRRQKRADEKALSRKAAAALPQVLEQYRWTCADMFEHSPVPIPAVPGEQIRLALSVFDPNDVVWIGSRYDSGSEANAANFRPVSEWVRQDNVWVHDQISPYVFMAGVHARTAANVVGQRFLVVESDELGPDEVGAVFRWLKESVGVPLLLVVHTGNKGLHGWFGIPGDDVKQQLRAILPAFKCDAAMFHNGQITRLPGGYRRDSGKLQQMLYFSGRSS